MGVIGKSVSRFAGRIDSCSLACLRYARRPGVRRMLAMRLRAERLSCVLGLLADVALLAASDRAAVGALVWYTERAAEFMTVTIQPAGQPADKPADQSDWMYELMSRSADYADPWADSNREFLVSRPD